MKKGFTLIEIMVVFAIIALLSSVLLASLTTARRSSRDAVRLSAMREMQTALELFYDEDETYPDGDGAGQGGWDTPGNETFITPLVAADFLRDNLRDPLVNDEYGNYKYFRFPAGSFDCDSSRGAFYVLGIVDMESSDGAHPRSPGFSCPSRDFGSEMEFVFGRFEK